MTISFQDKVRKYCQTQPIFVIAALGYLLLTFVPILLLDRATLRSLTVEDSYYEGVGALFWLIASILFFFLYVKYRESNNFYFMKTNRNIFFFLLACLFFLAFGEEISWGQRIIGFQTPDALGEINAQNEVNIHNLYFFRSDGADGPKNDIMGIFTNVGRLFFLFWFTYCLLIPIVYKMSSKAAEFFDKIALPMVPLWIGSLFVLNYVISKTFEWQLKSFDEIREHNYAFLFLVLAVWFVMKYESRFDSANVERAVEA